MTISWSIIGRWSGYGYCPQCEKANDLEAWCDPCDRKALVNKFNTWSTGDKDLDLFIQKTQRNATFYAEYLEYIPYGRFTDVKPLARGGFAEVFTATWLDGKREVKFCDKYKYTKGRSEPFTVVLKLVNNSANAKQSFTNELELHYQFYQQSVLFCECYGITRDPETTNYALILEYFPDGDLRKRLTDSGSKLNWESKLHQLEWICDNLVGMHNENYIHRDIHSGNILLNGNASVLTDFGLARPADSTKTGTYGIIPYMAPELFRGRPHSKASDTYAIGIIMSEYASNEPAFYNRDHDVHLQFAIIDGLRPEIPPGVPECYKELMNRCLSGDQQVRPAAEELRGLFRRWYKNLRDNEDTDEAKQFRTADEQSEPKQQKKMHPGAVYASRLVVYVETDTGNPISAVSTAPTSRGVTPLSTSESEICENDSSVHLN